MGLFFLNTCNVQQSIGKESETQIYVLQQQLMQTQSKLELIQQQVRSDGVVLSDGVVFFKHMQCPTVNRKRKRNTDICTPATAHANSVQAGANPATGQEGLYMSSCYMHTYRCIVTAHVS